MRVSALLLLFIFFSCKSNTSKGKILGTWTTDQDESKYPKNGVLDKLTFFKNDSFKVEMFSYGKLHDSFSGTYVLDENSRRLTTTVGSVVTQSEILELTNDRLSLEQEKSKTINNYIR